MWDRKHFRASWRGMARPESLTWNRKIVYLLPNEYFLIAMFTYRNGCVYITMPLHWFHCNRAVETEWSESFFLIYCRLLHDLPAVRLDACKCFRGGRGSMKLSLLTVSSYSESVLTKFETDRSIHVWSPKLPINQRKLQDLLLVDFLRKEMLLEGSEKSLRQHFKLIPCSVSLCS